MTKNLSFNREYLPILGSGSLVLFALYLISQANFLLFHTLAELISIVIAGTIFVLTWNSRQVLNNNYLLFLGISLLFVGGLDIVHTLAYKGMSVFPGTGIGQPNAANLATQLWLVGRFLQSASLVAAPFFVRRKFHPWRVALGFLLLSGLLLASVMVWKIFPAAYVDPTGLTRFKITSEYVIILLYTIGLIQFVNLRAAFDADVQKLLAASIIFNIITEIAFIEYLSVYGLINILGHFFKLVAFYLIYKAIIEMGFLRPHRLLFRELAESETALRDSEIRERTHSAQLEAIMDVVPAVVWIAHDPQARQVTGNRASAELLDLPPNANHSRYDPQVAERFRIFDKSGRKLAQNELAMHFSAATGQPVRDFEETVISGKDGSIRNLLGNVSPLLDEYGQPTGAVGAFIDITERVRAEQALQVSEQRYRGLFETMVEGFSLHEMVYDEQGKAVDYIFLEVNPALEQMVGIVRDDVVGKTAHEIAPNIDPALIERMGEVAATGQSQRFEQHSALVPKYFEVLLYRIGEHQVAVLTVDVTERRVSQQALRQSEARLRRLVESNIIGVIYSMPSGQITLANDAFLEMVGYTRADFETGAVDWVKMTPPEYLPQDEQAMTEASERGACTPYEKEYIRKDGTRVPILIGFAYLAEPDPLYICFILDLTEQKRAEMAVMQYAARLENSNREFGRANTELARANRELQDFAFVASHDLQEPLRKIQAFSERLTVRLKDQIDEESRDYLSRMLSAAERMRAMIDDLLSLSRVTTRGNVFEPVNLEDVAQEVVSDLELRIERSGGRVEVGKLPTFDADPIQMHQLLQNLLANALKFHKPDTPPLVKLYGDCIDDNQRVIIYVEDNGIGFDEQYLERIFQPFQRLHGMGQYEGSGVGLAICRKIVERHSGTITAQSTNGQGAKFIVNLPAHQASGEINKKWESKN